MKLTKTISKLALVSALFGTTVGTVGTTALTTTVHASATLPTSKTKDYNKMQRLARQDGITYTKPRYFNDWVPGNNVGDIYTMSPYKLANVVFDPGRQWDRIIGAGTIHGRAFFVEQNEGGAKALVPAEFYHVPYGFKFKKGHKPVECYFGSLAESWNGYDEYSGAYEGVHTESNTIYSDHEDGHRELTMEMDGQDRGKNQGFFIGLTPIHMSDGEDYYPVYSYTNTNALGVVYIKTKDIDQFERAKVTYKYIGTVNNHSFKPYRNKVAY